VRGAVLVSADRTVVDVFRSGISLRIEPVSAEQECFDESIRSVSEHKSGVRLTLSGISDRTAAEELAGARVLIARSDLPALAVGEYYDFEVVGCEVTTPDDRCLGMVTEVLATGASDVYVVVGEYGEILVPAVVGAVLSLDLVSKRIAVEPTALEYSNSTFEP